MGKDARGLTRFWSSNCLVPPEVRVNRVSRKIAEAAANVKNLTNPVVTLEEEVANPWRAGCGCATRRMDVMNVSSIAHSKWAMCLWSVAVRRGFLTVKELLLKGLVRWN
jgi:hypothetical protein